MNVISKPALDEAARRHPNARNWLYSWYAVAMAATWSQLADVREAYPTADQVDACLIFDACGNNYRLIGRVSYANDFANGTLFIKHFLTHAEYSRGNWKECCT